MIIKEHDRLTVYQYIYYVTIIKLTELVFPQKVAIISLFHVKKLKILILLIFLFSIWTLNTYRQEITMQV